MYRCDECDHEYTDAVNHLCEPPECANHKEVQHRDGRPPWCNTCGWKHMVPAQPARKMKNL